MKKDKDNLVVNNPKGIEIGKHVCVWANTNLLIESRIANEYVIGYGALVTKQFLASNLMIAGTLAKIIYQNIEWKN